MRWTYFASSVATSCTVSTILWTTNVLYATSVFGDKIVRESPVRNLLRISTSARPLS